MRVSIALVVLSLSWNGSSGLAAAQTQLGYYRQPCVSSDTVVFVAEGDLWKVSLVGGVATRLTSHPGDESRPAISPDGKTVAFSASYEGPMEAYTMPLAGGLPVRQSFEGGVTVWGWTQSGRVIAATDAYSTLPSQQIILITTGTGSPVRAIVPLSQAADGTYSDDGRELFFTRLPFQGSHTRRYKGGTAQSIWRYRDGDAEATPLTADFAGTSRRPMFWSGRVYFASDRDGVMNLWSMTPTGGDLRQHTRHADYEALSPSLGGGKIVYQHGADLRVYDISNDSDKAISISLDSDFDQTRERWIDRPAAWISAAHPSADGSHLVITARGRVFVAPHRQGRLVEAARKDGVRYRDARFLPDGKNLVALSDESGEIEFWKMSANGVGPTSQVTRGGDVLRWEGVPSPDGKRLATHDKNQRLSIITLDTGDARHIDDCAIDNFNDLAWSPDSRWLAYVKAGSNLMPRVRIYSVDDGSIMDATSERWESTSPAWSPDGKWLYFLSNRNLVTTVDSPWGSYQPEPFLDKKSRIYALALTNGLRSPFAPRDELNPDDKEPEKQTTPATQSAPATASASTPTSQTQAAAPASSPATQPAGSDKSASPVVVSIDREGLAARLHELPIAPGNYGNLSVTEKALFWTSYDAVERKTALSAAAIARENVEVKTVLADIQSYEPTLDRKKLLLRKGDSFYIVDANAAPADLDKKDVNLSGWTLSITPREEWRQMFVEAWRLERDYFYDRGMHGVDWKAILNKYKPLVDRVSTRAELSDLVAQMVAELSALHIFVTPGDARQGKDQIHPASLGAVLTRDESAGGVRVTRLYESDPDEPRTLSPLARPGVDVRVGDVIESVNGVSVLSVPDIALLLRGKAGQQVLLSVKPGGKGNSRQVIVHPISPAEASDLRYRDWELSRRHKVEKDGNSQIGYLHMRAMGGGNFTEFAKGFYPVFDRQGLIIDMRHNRGGNIDSWILGRLMRKAWFTWSQRVGQPPSWNMHYAFRGHIAVLCNEFTASDGEAFCEGIKRLGLGKVFGTRTWGGEIWLTSSNTLVDGGIATAAEYGVYGPEGQWLIEGHGVDPDVVVDNLPAATFRGQDAQLDAAIQYLNQQIKDKPVPPPAPPKHPDKSLRRP